LPEKSIIREIKEEIGCAISQLQKGRIVFLVAGLMRGAGPFMCLSI
jgi:hypothetical protein